MNGGVSNLGFTRTQAREEFKAKPDFITGQVFVASRQDVAQLWENIKNWKYLKPLTNNK